MKRIIGGAGAALLLASGVTFIASPADAAPADSCRVDVSYNNNSAAARCPTSAPGTQYRLGIDCTNSGFRYGPWRTQGTSASAVGCLGSGTIERFQLNFR